MIFGVIAYVIGSYFTYTELFNLDRMLHRGIYSDNKTPKLEGQSYTFRGVINKLLGIDSNYTRGDKAIAWSVMLWSLGYNFLIMFVGVLIWNAISPWTNEQWSIYFFINSICTALIVGSVSTVWFVIGGIIDTRALFRDLARRVSNPLDNGQVSGHVSLCDVKHFNKIEHEDKHEEENKT
jgi:solute:Na+ symporter, SSS family